MPPLDHSQAGNGRFQVANGPRIRFLRHLLGWSQEELARRAGYSDRLIRKAEASGQLRRSTLFDLSRALSTSLAPISVDDLILTSTTAATLFLECFQEHGSAMLRHCPGLLAEEFVFRCDLCDRSSPFVGEWRGAKGMQAWLELFCQHFRRSPDPLAIEYATGARGVSARYLERLATTEANEVRFWVNMHFQVRESQITSIDYDTDGTALAGLIGKSEPVRPTL